MNKITFPRKTYEGEELSKSDLEKWYCNEVENKIRKRLYKVCGSLDLEKFIKKHLHCILLASPSFLEKMTNLVDRSYNNLFRKNGKKTKFGTDIYNAFNYDGFRSNVLIGLAEKLNVKSCPYCNMQYTLFAEDGQRMKDKIANMQFDHFYDKAEYPFLSMSLYNLIPSCGVCNQGKSTRKISLKFHPYASEIHEQFHFEAKEPLMLYYGGKKDRIEIDLVTDNVTSNELNAFERTFNIKTLYRRHGDIIQEVFDKSYEDTYYDNLSNFSFLKGKPVSYKRRLIYGTYMDAEDIHKRPMSKLIQDIEKQAKGRKNNKN